MSDADPQRFAESRPTRCVVPGRFQPFHLAHAACIEHAAELYDEVYVAISNAHISHTASDPFSGGERFEMILSHLKSVELDRSVHVLPVPVDDAPTTWVSTIIAMAPPLTYVYTRSAATASLFDFWHIPRVPSVLRGMEISGTNVRQLIATDGAWRELVPPSTVNVIERYSGAARVRELLRGRNYREQAEQPTSEG